MKRIIIMAIFCTSLNLNIIAQKTKVEWKNGDPLDIVVGHPSVVPTVTSDNDEVAIRCDSIIYDVNVIISNQYGHVIHNSIQTIGPDDTFIFVPNQEESIEMSNIDLYYDKKHLKGTFEQ